MRSAMRTTSQLPGRDTTDMDNAHAPARYDDFRYSS